MKTSHFSRYVGEIVTLVAFVIVMVLSDLVGAQQAPQAMAVELGDYSFSPSNLEVEASRPVLLTLINKDRVTPHNFSLRDAAAGLDVDADIGAGASVVVEFMPETAGSYTFYCNKKLPFVKSHRARGMQGTLTVIEKSSE